MVSAEDGIGRFLKQALSGCKAGGVIYGGIYGKR